ncbi:MAG TPA: hypothetical protein VJV79_16360, partial [Polyangiaceae bacterium]|nr:hypothetical protein [Polyangiaceae bacterium]
AGIGGMVAGQACTSCAATACGGAVDACRNSPSCAPWLSCISACDSQVCIDACDLSHTEVARLYSPVYACLCEQCPGECSVAQSCTKPCVDEAPLLPTSTVPRSLAETGLFAGSPGAPGTAALTLAAQVRPFVPKYPLWSDGADKDRYIYIPKCAAIDTSNMDQWRFPVGTRVWKTFIVPTALGERKRVETRLLHRYGEAREAWLYAAYQWDEGAPNDPGLALPRPSGVLNANGTSHDIPSELECADCHGKLPARVLGFSAFQLSHSASGDDLNIERISNLGWLTVPAPGGFAVPGSPVQQAALGYLHANCGNCHNSNGQSPPGSPMLLRLLVEQTDYASTDVVTSTVGVDTFSNDAFDNGTARIFPMDPSKSSVLIRMQIRGTELQMPPLVTTSSKVADATGGVADVSAWINSLE